MKISAAQYHTFDFDEELYDYSDEVFEVKIPYQDVGGKRVLFVIDHVPTDDLKYKRLLKGTTGDLLQNLINNLEAESGTQFKHSWACINFNAYRTYGKSPEFKQEAFEVFKERLLDYIDKYEPDYVVGFGNQLQHIFLGDNLVIDQKNNNYLYSNWLGVPVDCKIGKREFKYVANLSLDFPVNETKAPRMASAANLLGYYTRNLRPLVGVDFRADGERVAKHKGITIKTIKQFDDLMTMLEDHNGPVAIDTEARNLNRIVNSLLTVQFAVSQDEGYLLPIHHKDSPFVASELKYIKQRLKEYFEGNNNNEYHIYTNGKFDINLFRSQLGIEYYHNDLWDIQGAEFTFDENLKELPQLIGNGYYNLANLAVQYGITAYLHNEFGKADRGGFYKADLTPDVVRYTTLDVVVPFAIHLQQKKRAKYERYPKFEDVVLGEISDTIHAFSLMESTGANVDVEYLFMLKSEISPIRREVERLLKELYATEACQTANARLAKKHNIPLKGWSGPTQVFKINKDEHKQMLFFEVLRLKPINYGKAKEGEDPKPSIDKKFQEAYKDVKEVALYTELGKAKKLYDAFVKSFLKKLAEHDDFRSDHRIRSTYEFLKVVTQRTSSNDPNLQQIPSRSVLGKEIKRLFVARSGSLYIKVDYRVHEVRGWGLVSDDSGISDLFNACKKLRDKFRRKPNYDLGKRLEIEADVHVQNAMYFFQKAKEFFQGLKKVWGPVRNNVKGVIFGLIYQKGIKALANDIGQTEEFTETLVNNFRKRFPNGMKWIDDVKAFVKKNYYVEGPTGLRRHLFAYLLPESMDRAASQLYARADRQGVNSPIQGMCGKFMMNGIRYLDGMIFKEKARNPDFGLYVTNSVHDSLENEALYASFMKSLHLIEYALTEGVQKRAIQRHGFKFVSPLEVDFEIGPDLKNCESWDFSFPQLVQIVYDSLNLQVTEHKHDINVDEVMDTIFMRFDDYPDWLFDQVLNLTDKDLPQFLERQDVDENGEPKVDDKGKPVNIGYMSKEAYKYCKRYIHEAQEWEYA